MPQGVFLTNGFQRVLTASLGLDECGGIYLRVGIRGLLAAVIYLVSHLGGDVVARRVLVDEGEMAQAVPFHLLWQVGVESRRLVAQWDGEFSVVSFSCQVGDIRAYHEVIETGDTTQGGDVLRVFLG